MPIRKSRISGAAASFGATADRPTNPQIGEQFVNGTLGITEVYTENDGWQPLTSSSTGIPYGTSANRPANPELGQPYFNADEARLEMYTTATGWQNIVQETPSVVSIVGSYLEFGGSQEITINGTNFAAGANALAVGTNGVEISADYTTLVSVVEIKAAFTNLSSEFAPYDIKVVNPSNLYGVLYETLAVDETYIWDKQSGSLGTYIEESPISVITTSIFDDLTSPVVFSVTSGSLPVGLTLNTATGAITGTPIDIVPNTTYNFTVSATDGNSTATRNFSITINDRGPIWQTSQTLSAFSKNIAYSQLVEAVDDNLQVIGYSLVAGSLPTGLSLNSSTGEISGTPTSDATAIFTLRATDTNSGAYSDRQFTIPNPGPAWQTAQAFDVSTADNSIQLSAIDDSGIEPTYSVIVGNLPLGMSLSTSGLLTGASQESGGAVSNFTVRATDNNGVTSDRSFSVTTVSTGQSLYTSPGTYSWVAPAGVTSVSVVAIGGGGSGASANSGHAGGGGGLGWKNNIPVTPGSSYTVVVGSGGASVTGGASGIAGGVSYFVNTSTVAGYGGQGGTAGGEAGSNETPQPLGGSFVGDGGGNGGKGGYDNYNYAGPGGGGAGGYSGSGGEGGGHWSSSYNGLNGTGGAGGGGSSGYNASGQGAATGGGGGGGGGVGVYGEGASGAGGIMPTTSTYAGGRFGNGGSGGASGSSGLDSDAGGNGGLYGAGGGGTNGNRTSGSGGRGAVRIIWGPNRAFPSTNTQDI